MKTNLLKVSFLLVFSVNIFAQIDTTSLSYYPLNDGDYWEYLYELDDYLYPPGGYVAYYSYKVIGDTLLPINKTYKIIEIKKFGSSQTPTHVFERVDTATCNVYRYDTYYQSDLLIDSLNSLPGDSCNATRTGYFGSTGTICTNIETDSILNRVTVSITFVEQHWHSPIEYKLSKGFGLTYLNYYFDFGQFTQLLLYAVIDSIEYGTQVNTIKNNNETVLKEFHLYQNYPNPFNSTTIIPFELPQKSKVEITIYDVVGRRIKILISGEFNKGMHNISWNGTNQTGQQVASGVYFYSFNVKTLYGNDAIFVKSAKLLLLR